MDPTTPSPTEDSPLLHQTGDVSQEPAFRVLTKNVDLGVNNSWKTEAKLMLAYSLPLITTYLLQYLYDLVIIWSAGHLGTNELAAVSLGLTTMNIMGFAIFEGMATSLDTLCAQAYGAGNVKLVGVHVQRMTLFLLLVAVPIGTLWICSPWILGAIVRQQNLAVLAGSFLRYSLIGLPGYATFECGKRFLQAQGNFTGPLFVLILCAPVYILLNWLFVFRLHLGVAGAALAAALVKILRPILLFLYVCLVVPKTLQCWPGFLPSPIFRNWGPMIWLSLPGAFMTLCEWFALEILTFSTSYVGTAHLAAQTLLASTTVLLWHIPFSASVAASTRIGHYIGHGAIESARRITRIYAALFVVIGLLNMAVLLALKNVIPTIFTDDKEVRTIAIRTIPIVAGFLFFDSTTTFVHGIFRGLGRQAIGWWATLIVNYLYAVPLALLLELGPLRLGLNGLWAALGSGLAILTFSQALILEFMSWQRCVDDARKREESLP